MAYGCYIFANSLLTIYKYNHVYYVEIFGNLQGGCIQIVTKMKIPQCSQGRPWFIRNLGHEMVDNKMYCVVCIVVWHSKYELREDLTQLHIWVNSRKNIKVCYCTMSMICKWSYVPHGDEEDK